MSNPIQRFTQAEVDAISARNRASRAHRLEESPQRGKDATKRRSAGQVDSRVAKTVQEATGGPIRKDKGHSGTTVGLYEGRLRDQCRAAGLPEPVMELRFSVPRRWRIDLAFVIPATATQHIFKLAVEIDGAVHRISKRFDSDLAKHQALFFAGWRLLRVSTFQVRNGEAVKLIERALA